jgi:hypothetical protein
MPALSSWADGTNRDRDITSKSVSCAECGECLDSLPPLPSGETAPCPKCGSTARTLYKTTRGSITPQGHLASLQTRADRAIGFRESAREGRAASADRHDDGFLSYSISGSSPQGEEDTPTACRVLVSVLNASGGNSTDPVRGEGVIDCPALDRELADKRLSIQVVRAIVDQSLWERLNQQGRAEELNVSEEQLVAQVKDAIQKKANDRAIPRAVRQSLTLAHDATRLPVLGFQDVVEEFQAQSGRWAKSLGFGAVWLLGPHDSLTWRFDAQA